MDIDGQHEEVDPEDPHGVRAAAADVLEAHRQHSITGLCDNCGRPWDPEERCGAPEVMNALGVTRKRQPFRKPGANRLTVAYDLY